MVSIRENSGQYLLVACIVPLCVHLIMSVPLPLPCLIAFSYIFSKLLLLTISMWWVSLLSCTCEYFHVGTYSLSLLTRATMLDACKRGRRQGDNISRLLALVNTQDSNSWKLKTTWNFSSESSSLQFPIISSCLRFIILSTHCSQSDWSWWFLFS